LLGSLYERVLDSFKVHSKYRLDTFPIPFGTGNSRIILPERVNNAWAMKRTKTYPFFYQSPAHIFLSNALIFAELNYDYNFFIKDLLWPMLAFFFILLISNIALVFVYKDHPKTKKDQ
jgi:hypothetical protein